MPPGSQEGGQMSFALGPKDMEQVLREEPLPRVVTQLTQVREQQCDQLCG